MAIGSFYDANRDMYYVGDSRQAAFEREIEMQHRRHQEEVFRRTQNSYFNTAQQPQLMNTAPKPDTEDPLAFLTKTDNKLLLTGEAS
jgi:hypothetical protein